MHDLTINFVALSPGHSQFFNGTCRTFEQRVSLNSWEWLGDEADNRHVRRFLPLYSIRLSIVYRRAFCTEGAFICSVKNNIIVKS